MQPDPRTLACLERLIGFDTVSRNSNLDCIDWARAHMEAHGARTRMVWNADRTKANMLATFGEGPGGMVLSGHVDVVPVDGQDWSSDPFTATVRDGRVYGRGACDMKGFDAVVLGHVPDYAAAKLKQPIHVALTYDEELGCLGIPHLISAMRAWDIRPTGCIVGEPTSMRLVSAHKGGRVFRCRVTGKAAHSSLTHTAVNAIEYAARIIARIQDISDRERESGLRAAGFDVPFTTISTNLISGGNGPNIVPALAEFVFDYRYVPGFDPDSIITELRELAAALTARMQAIDPGTGIEFIPINAIPALAPDEDTEVFRMALDLVVDKSVEKVAYGTEASFFQQYGVPSIVCGPGSIAQAHKADEYVELDQLAACDRFIASVVRRLSA
ncbi:acetylornithine deacetylase [Limobrevibacterium gyesilva]|uniref:Acetylornithine deacetylase n=1 Tax=Limobrevibacterium gyesilva TaxID=2991712 RepID=A0AA41YN30_9PROT|nr:acetylornithine deacetylase [Limobrevibacterium gyesilva]MCW3475078.1 acetylornithine deacetylase [Limobrevibacterium gyesilva]